MDVEAKPSDHSVPLARSARGYRIARLVRVIAMIVAAFVFASAILVIPAWLPFLPRPLRRGLTEGLLRAVLFGYGGLFLVAIIAPPVLAVILLRSRRAGRRRPIALRGLLVAISCLFSLTLLELGSSGWRLWMHRFPRLPVTFPADDGGSIADRGPGWLKCAWRAFSPLDFGRADRGLAAGERSTPKRPVRMRDPGVAG